MQLPRPGGGGPSVAAQVPFMPGRLHDWHCPVQAWSQQIPPTQKPEPHCPGCAQAAPLTPAAGPGPASGTLDPGRPASGPLAVSTLINDASLGVSRSGAGTCPTTSVPLGWNMHPAVTAPAATHPAASHVSRFTPFAMPIPPRAGLKAGAGRRKRQAADRLSLHSGRPRRAGLATIGARVPVQSKRWNDPADGSDGFRVLVSRFRPRGIAKANETWATWWPELGPSRALHADFYGKNGPALPFVDDRRRSLAEIGDRSCASGPLPIGPPAAR